MEGGSSVFCHVALKATESNHIKPSLVNWAPRLPSKLGKNQVRFKTEQILLEQNSKYSARMVCRPFAGFGGEADNLKTYRAKKKQECLSRETETNKSFHLSHEFLDLSNIVTFPCCQIQGKD